MSSKRLDGSNPVRLFQCKFHGYGCTDLISQDRLSTHYCREQHVKALINWITSQQINYECALIDLVIHPLEASPETTITITNFEQLIGRLTDAAIETFEPPSLVENVSMTSSSFDRIYDRTDSSSRSSTERMDRNSNSELHLQSCQEQQELNAAAMNDLSNRIVSPSVDDQTNDIVGQNQELLSVPEQRTNDFCRQLNELLQIQQEFQPYSTDGRLSWHIQQILEKIEDPTFKIPLRPINSRPFKTAMHDQGFWVRVHFNSTTDPDFISLHVHLNFPMNAPFRGTITFVLVDQSTENPLEHKVKSRAGLITEVNGRLGWDQLIEQNLLRQKGNRYVKEDSIWILIGAKETTEEASADYTSDVMDPFMLIA